MIDNKLGETIASAKVAPHILEKSERGEAIVEVPRALRQEPLTVFVEWVDPEQISAWEEHGSRKERKVGPLVPVGVS